MLVSLVKLARPTQWVKNGVVLAAVIFAGEVTHVVPLELALAAVAVFCVLSSAVYTLNDIVDRDKDRRHPLKKERPIASGRVSVGTAAIMVVLLAAAGLVSAWLVGREFLYISLAFLGLNVAYSFWLKNIVIVDAMTIAMGFVLRAYAGGVAIDVPVSRWLIVNTLFLALFLAFGKRRHELTLLEDGAASHREILSRYSPYLLDQLIAVVTPSVVVAYMLYTISEDVMAKLGTGHLFLTIPFVVYGVFRYLYLIHKEDKGGSPTRLLITDRPILINVILWLATVVVVLYLT